MAVIAFRLGSKVRTYIITLMALPAILRLD